MYMLIRYPIGIIVEAVVLARGRNRMRVAVAGFPDAIELRRTGAEWLTETREPVEFDFLLSHSQASENINSSRPGYVFRATVSAATQ
jgi:hypothetical protein